jgi:dihydrofolate reductase
MTLSLIACCDLNKAIGYQNKLLTHLPNDLRRFKELTTDSICIQGRLTYESIIEMNGKPLQNRINIVLTKNKKYKTDPSTFVYHSIEDILKDYKGHGENQEVFVIGGSTLYEHFMPYVDQIYLTIIDHRFESVDTYFPEIDYSVWKVASFKRNKVDDKHPYEYKFLKYVKRNQ